MSYNWPTTVINTAVTVKASRKALNIAADIQMMSDSAILFCTFTSRFTNIYVMNCFRKLTAATINNTNINTSKLAIHSCHIPSVVTNFRMIASATNSPPLMAGYTVVLRKRMNKNCRSITILVAKGPTVCTSSGFIAKKAISITLNWLSSFCSISLFPLPKKRSNGLDSLFVMTLSFLLCSSIFWPRELVPSDS